MGSVCAAGDALPADPGLVAAAPGECAGDKAALRGEAVYESLGDANGWGGDVEGYPALMQRGLSSNWNAAASWRQRAICSLAVKSCCL